MQRSFSNLAEAARGDGARHGGAMSDRAAPEMVVILTPPDPDANEVDFRITVVHDGETFWEGAIETGPLTPEFVDALDQGLQQSFTDLPSQRRAAALAAENDQLHDALKLIADLVGDDARATVHIGPETGNTIRAALAARRARLGEAKGGAA